jgi:phage FluMu gp28-like protein
LPYQQKWIADKNPLKIGEKSRRIGLTWAEAADATLEVASDRSAGGQNCYYLGYNKDMTVEFVQACAMWAKAYDLAAEDAEEGIWDDGDDKYIKPILFVFRNQVFVLKLLQVDLQTYVVVKVASFWMKQHSMRI